MLNTNPITYEIKNILSTLFSIKEYWTTIKLNNNPHNIWVYDNMKVLLSCLQGLDYQPEGQSR